MKYEEYRYKFLDVVKHFNDDIKRRFIDFKDENGNTTFIILCLRGYEELVDLFISFGADVDARNGWFTPLTAACRDGHLGTVNILLDKGSIVNQTNIDEETPLYTACICGHYRLVKCLIKRHANITKPNKFYHTPLYVSCMGGYENIVKLLIHEGATVCDCSDSLIGATHGGHDKIVQTLITESCGINSVDVQGRTALLIACEEGHTKIVRLLLDQNADICKGDYEGRTPLDAARSAGNYEIESILIQTNSDVKICHTDGANIFKPYKNDLNPLDLTDIDSHVINSMTKKSLKTSQLVPNRRLPIFDDKENKYQEQKHDNTSKMLQYGWTPLYEACMRGDIQTVLSLIKNHANVNMTNSNGETPLIAACQQGSGRVIDMLLNEGADINQSLFISIMNNYDSMVKILVSKGRDFGYEHDKRLNWTSLMTVACTNRSIIAITFLIEKGIAVNQVNKNEHAPICIACTQGYHEIIELLIKNGAKLNNRCKKDGKAPLYFACKLGFYKITETLIVNRGDFKKKYENGKTLLHIACNNKVFKLLTDIGLDYCIHDTNGRYPLFESMFKGFDDISECLVQNNAPIATSAVDKKTALISVFQTGNKELSMLLVSKGYTKNLINFNETMLYHAYRLGLFETVKTLLQDGADFRKTYDFGYTPMIIADIAGNDTLSEYLQCTESKTKRSRITSGFYINSEEVDGRNIEVVPARIIMFRYMNANYEYLFRVCITGEMKEAMPVRMNTNMFFKLKKPTESIWFVQTPLCLASRRGHTEIVKMLLKYDATVNLTFEDHENYTSRHVDESSLIIRYGYTPLFAALQRKYHKIVEILLESGANLNKALYDACREGYFDVAQFLLEKGADHDVNSMCRFGQSAFHAACIGGSYKIVKLLIARGAIIDTSSIKETSDFVVYHNVFKLLIERNESIDKTGNIAQALLHAGCKNGDYRNVEILIDRGVNVDVSNSDGLTPLIACMLQIGVFNTDKQFKVIELLIKKMANINRTDDNGRTPLFIATKVENIRLINFLLDNGADININALNGMTPISVARSKGGSVMEVFLKQRHRHSSSNQHFCLIS